MPAGLKKFKLALFTRIGDKIRAQGGRVVHGDFDELRGLPPDVIPIVGCTPQFREDIALWRGVGRRFIYWDRGYARRVFATWLPRGGDGGYYRWHVGTFQMERVRDVSDDRWLSLLPGVPNDPRSLTVSTWRRNGRHIVVADTGFDYWDLHADRDWTARTVEYLRMVTDRPIQVRMKESADNKAAGIPEDLREHLRGAHCLVTHGSIAAVESVVMGCPVFVDRISAAALVGRTDFSKIEEPVYPEREAWLHSLAYCQFNERELVDGTLWRLIE